MSNPVDIPQLERSLRAQLASDGWTVTVACEVQPERIRVAVAHPLLSAYRVFDTAMASWREHLDDWLASSELDLVRNRPANMPHMRFVGRLRAVAGVHFWSADELRDLTSILVSHGALSRDESHWLDVAGPAGHGQWEYEHFVAERQERLAGTAAGSPDELARGEHDVMADRPPMHHAELVADLRALAGARRWPRRDLESLADLLWDCDVITAEELAWLIWVGPPGNDEPSPLSSWRQAFQNVDD